MASLPHTSVPVPLLLLLAFTLLLHSAIRSRCVFNLLVETNLHLNIGLVHDYKAALKTQAPCESALQAHSHSSGSTMGRWPTTYLRRRPPPSSSSRPRSGRSGFYDADPAIIKALANTGIRIVIGAANGNIPTLASNPNLAMQWVSSNVLPLYAASNIVLITVGNEPNPGRLDSGSGITYMSMFDAQVDAVRAALNSMRFDDIEIMVAETGWPYRGDSNEIGPTLGMLGLTTSPSGSETPVSPSPKSNGSWCTARSGVPDTKLQAALNYACGQGIECRAIQPGGPCFEPNTFTSHAAYAMYLDYQHSAKGTDDCELTQSAMLTSKNPSKTSFYISPRLVF
ncbi:hypothetical protein CDL15_Pgr010464 [Punica granatum]|uniref:glucan endo-1,3-beta-D-glucosidase n=1 Tax=Punica granatum TaxID=22663 RepID=A0A218XWL9_PUNGR|nr:hypothetical protein CDL15_Pgr010464 [Punica granatum]